MAMACIKNLLQLANDHASDYDCRLKWIKIDHGYLVDLYMVDGEEELWDTVTIKKISLYDEFGRRHFIEVDFIRRPELEKVIVSLIPKAFFAIIYM